MAYRRQKNSDTWHFCRNCSKWPTSSAVQFCGATSKLPNGVRHIEVPIVISTAGLAGLA